MSLFPVLLVAVEWFGFWPLPAWVAVGADADGYHLGDCGVFGVVAGF
jgi:hypothetical protein